MSDRLRIAIAQINPTVGAIAGNLEKLRQARAEAARMGADLVAFSELFLAGYPPEDLVLRGSFITACRDALDAVVADTADGGPAVAVGLPIAEDGKLYNSYAIADGGALVGIRHKVELPNYGVFDEKRVFDSGPLPGPVGFRGFRLGLPICEDLWFPEVAECLSETGAELLISPNGSPYWRGKQDERLAVMVARVVETGLPLVYINQISGQDELVFDGGSFGLNGDKTLSFQMPQMEESIGLAVFERGAGGVACIEGPKAVLPDTDEADWRAVVVGLRDYVEKNRFPGVVLGLSGGIDSAIVAAIAVDALGPDRVHAVMMPYRYTASDSLEDAAACADLLGIRYDTLPIAGPVEGLEATLSPIFDGLARDVTEENLQSRVRGTILMAISNKLGSMLVTTGNKSEMSVGYATLYGDMNGGFNPIKDLYKTEVYRLAAWRNTNRPAGVLGPSGTLIPERILTKAPTAELRENQTDQDSLPPYDILDATLKGLVEEERSLADIVASGIDEAVVRRIQHLLYIAEYKRRQSAPGVKITRRNFGRDRRYPITNGYRDR
ncbi:MAG: NAD+ synthase [Hyphomicrobiaceae bacterium]|nr:NAD+ synthase [Hyphomicrobiaceae bacterium]